MITITEKCKTCGGEKPAGAPHGERCLTTAEEYKNFIQARLAACALNHAYRDSDGNLVIDIDDLELNGLL